MKPTPDDILESATTLVEATLALDIVDAHKRDVLNMVLWKITEASGKYTTRHRSAGAVAAPKGTKVHHEHVNTRKELVTAIMNEPSRARELLQTAVSCVVTTDERRRLTTVTREQPHLRGWERYEAAGITVVDTDANRQD